MKTKSIILSVCLLFCSVQLCGCSDYKEYEGEYKDLYTEACYSLICHEGFLRSEDIHQSAIDLIEEDNYGRKLFSYYEEQWYSTADGQKYILSLLICQKSDDDYVYYYPDINYYSVTTQYINVGHYDSHRPTHVSDPLSKFKEEEIYAIKMKNDWNKEFREEKCIREKIITNKKEIEIDKTLLDGICNDILSKEDYSHLASYRFLCEDEYGRKIYGFNLIVRSREYHRYFAVILNPDMTYDRQTFSVEIYGPFNCQNELQELKLKNNWDMPYNRDAV